MWVVLFQDPGDWDMAALGDHFRLSMSLSIGGTRGRAEPEGSIWRRAACQADQVRPSSHPSLGSVFCVGQSSGHLGEISLLSGVC